MQKNLTPASVADIEQLQKVMTAGGYSPKSIVLNVREICERAKKTYFVKKMILSFFQYCFFKEKILEKIKKRSRKTVLFS